MNIRSLLDVEGTVDLTPMIDMVFQLIIFFVVVNDFSSATMEHLVLPSADQAAKSKSKGLEERMAFVNIRPDGTIRINGKTYGGPGIADTLLKEYLQIEGQMAGTEPVEGAAKPLSKLRVVIRADASTRYEHVQKVFRACAENAIYKTVINAFQEPLKRVK